VSYAAAGIVGQLNNALLSLGPGANATERAWLAFANAQNAMVLDSPGSATGVYGSVSLFPPGSGGSGSSGQVVVATVTGTGVPATPVSAAEFEVQGVIGATSQGSPPAGLVGAAGFYGDVDGAPAGVTPGGWTGTARLSQVDAGTLTNANAAGPVRLSAIYTIPANDLNVGTKYVIEMPYSATMEATNTLELGLSIDGAVAFTANDTISAAIVGGGVGIHGVVRVILQCTATGAATGRINAFVDGTTGQAGATATFANRGSLTGAALSVTLDTTVSHTIRVNSLWGGLTAGQTTSGIGSECTRTGP
jgi:hypothetical protein